MRRLRLMTPALLLAALPVAAAAEPDPQAMSPEARAAFRAEVRAYLLEYPELLTEMVAILEARQREQAAALDGARIAAQAEALFEDGFSYVGGDPGGDVTLVAFLDYQCGYCKRAHAEVAELVGGDGGVRWIVKELPILGPASEHAARATTATLIVAGPEAYGRVHDGLMRLDGPVTETSVAATLAAAGVDAGAVAARMHDPEVTRRLDATRALAAELEIQGTPTFVLRDRMLRGYVPLAAMQGIVAELRAAE
jgi:protein-disulfide isomerase